MDYNRSAILSCDSGVANLLSAVLIRAGYDRPQRSEALGVAKLGTYAPRVLMIDCDHIRGDKLESIRQVRFVLPDCTIAVVSSDLHRDWAKKCHMAGVSGVLFTKATIAKMAAGLRLAVETGCHTDSAFSAAPSESSVVG